MNRHKKTHNVNAWRVRISILFCHGLAFSFTLTEKFMFVLMFLFFFLEQKVRFTKTNLNAANELKQKFIIAFHYVVQWIQIRATVSMSTNITLVIKQIFGFSPQHFFFFYFRQKKKVKIFQLGITFVIDLIVEQMNVTSWFKTMKFSWVNHANISGNNNNCSNNTGKIFHFMLFIAQKKSSIRSFHLSVSDLFVLIFSFLCALELMLWYWMYVVHTSHDMLKVSSRIMFYYSFHIAIVCSIHLTSNSLNAILFIIVAVIQRHSTWVRSHFGIFFLALFSSSSENIYSQLSNLRHAFSFTIIKIFISIQSLA